MAVGVIRGVVGQIRWSYYNAAAVNGYTVVRKANGRGQPEWSLKGTVVAVDKFKMTQRPLIFTAPHDKGRWQWVIEEFTIHEGAITARLGPLEVF